PTLPLFPYTTLFRSLAHDGEREARGLREAERAQDEHVAALIDADGAGHEAEDEVDHFRQRLDDERRGARRLETEQMQGDVNLEDRGGVREEIERDDPEERAAPMTIEVIEVTFDAQDVLAPRKQRTPL